ncbi:MAG: NAD(P)-binding domain-containing protein, partial [Thermoleophilaceae bacterium]
MGLPSRSWARAKRAWRLATTSSTTALNSSSSRALPRWATRGKAGGTHFASSRPGASVPSRISCSPGDPDGFPNKEEVPAYLASYVETFGLPVEVGTRINSVSPQNGSYVLEAPGGRYEARQVVIATGGYHRPFIPSHSTRLDDSVFQIHTAEYRNPAQIPPGDVLVVGAGNSGAQIAEELSATRRVYLSVGTWLASSPRRVLGRDLFWWVERLGIWAVS